MNRWFGVRPYLGVIRKTTIVAMTNIPSIISVIAASLFMSVQASTLSVSTWGGEHGKAINLEFLAPFAEQAGISIAQNSPPGSEDLTAIPEGVVELSLYDAIDQCDNNHLMLLPTESLARTAAGEKIIQDYLPNALQPCAVGHSVWATVMAYNTSHIVEADKPHLIGDFFNTTYYPGKRVMRKSPQVLIEWALVASGIPGTDVYKALNDPESVWSLIEKKLNLIKHDIVWVERDIDALELLQSGEATFAMVSNDSLVRYADYQREDLGVLWDAAVTELAMWAIPTDAPNPAISWDFLQFVSDVAQSGKVASVFGYGPVRYSTLDLMDRGYHHLLPTAPQNRQNLLWGNSKWWRESSTAVISRFAAWLMEIETQNGLTLASVSEELPIASHLVLDDTIQIPIVP